MLQREEYWRNVQEMNELQSCLERKEETIKLLREIHDSALTNLQEALKDTISEKKRIWKRCKYFRGLLDQKTEEMKALKQGRISKKKGKDLKMNKISHYFPRIA